MERLVSIKIEDLPDEELRVVTRSFSYLKRSGCKNELNVRDWYIKPSLSKNQLWIRQFEDCLSTQLGRWKLKQTRSADEPMTQICTCTGCGKEWRQ